MAWAELLDSTEDSILDGRVILYQPCDGYRAAVDPVLLAAAVRAEAGDRALDLGCGAGAAMLCLAARCEGVEVDGLEVQTDLVDLAARNIIANGFERRLQAVAGDLLNPPAQLERESYAHVFANPPYMNGHHGNPPPNPSKKIAHVEGSANLENWVTTALSFCRRKGTVTFIQRTDRLAELLVLLNGRAGEITVFPLWPRENENSHRVIVRARKAIKSPMQLMGGLTLHNNDGSYTPAADRALKGGELRLRS